MIFQYDVDDIIDTNDIWWWAMARLNNQMVYDDIINDVDDNVDKCISIDIII